jgi:acyl-CoA dehydrogenase
VLSCLYLASSAVWRYQAEAQPRMLPFARAAIRVQLSRGADTLRELHANLPSRALRFIAPLLLHGTRQGRPLPDKVVLELADALRDDPNLVAHLCPDLSMPAQGGLRDLMQALELSRPVADELPQLNHALRRTRSLEQAAAASRDPQAALAYLRAADRVIQVDDFAP